jgi:hypothetical protein
MTDRSDKIEIKKCHENIRAIAVAFHNRWTGARLDDIFIHPQIDCPEYRNLFHVIRSLDPNKRPAPVALDLPKSKYGENISCDEWMADSIARIFESNPNTKMLVLVGLC